MKVNVVCVASLFVILFVHLALSSSVSSVPFGSLLRVHGTEHFDRGHIASIHARSDPLVYEVLATFYAETQGPSWIQQCRNDALRQGCWGDQTVSACDWFGLSCDSNGNITSIVLQNNGLFGPLPSVVAQLKSLRSVDLSRNRLGPDVPASWKDLSLTKLILDETELQGSVSLGEPLQIVMQEWCVKGIAVISFRFNRVHGQFPDDFGNSCLYLEYLRITANLISGPIPSTIGNIPFLVYLEADGNMLSGPIPPSIGNLAYMIYLNLADNKLTMIPAEMSAMTSLETMDVSYNMIEGTFPSQLLSIPSLSFLNLAANRLTGPLPDAALRSPFLKRLFLSGNSFSGALPSLEPGGKLLENCSLRDVALDHNMFTGPLTSHVFDIPQLSFIDFSYNDFEGPFDFVRVGEALVGSYLSFVSFEGNWRMNLNGTVVPPNLLFTRDNTITYRENSFVCSGVALSVVPSLSIRVPPSYFSYENCQCMPYTVGLPPSDCYSCPANGECIGGGNFVFWNQGYYPIISPANGAVFALARCLDTTFSFSDSNCCPSGNCSASFMNVSQNDQASWCNAGSSSRLCSRCSCPESGSSCHVYADFKCVSCHSTGMILASVLSVVAAVLLFLVLLRFVSRAFKSPTYTSSPAGKEKTTYFTSLMDDETRRLSSLVQVFVNYLQILAALLKNSAVEQESLIWVAHAVSWSLFSPSQSTGLSCLFPSLHSPDTSFLFLISIPVVLIAVLVLVSFISQFFMEMRGVFGGRGPYTELLSIVTAKPTGTGEASLVSATWKRKWVLLSSKLAFLVIPLLYFGITNQTLSTFSCNDEPFTGRSYMNSAPWIECSDSNPTYRHLKAVSIVSLVVYVIGIPVLQGVCLLFVRHHRESSQISYCMSGLLSPYQRNVFYYSVVIVVRRLLLAVFLATVSQSSAWRQFGVLVVLLGSLVIHIKLYPWKTVVGNRCEEAALYALIVLQGALMQFDGSNVDQSSSQGTYAPGPNSSKTSSSTVSLVIVSLFICLSIGAVMLGCIMHSLWRCVRLRKALNESRMQF
eukprot:ANDGO_01935.mRNA.1 Putative leucine-rich repeat-containing protein DDB_G0281931